MRKPFGEITYYKLGKNTYSPRPFLPQPRPPGLYPSFSRHNFFRKNCVSGRPTPKLEGRVFPGLIYSGKKSSFPGASE